MTREEATIQALRNHIEVLEENIRALEQEPMEKFESVKDHIFKLAGDYKCWDNRLTYDEALELCHILEQEPCEDCVSRQSMLDAITEIDDNTNMDIYTNEVREIIGALPSVATTRKKGKWIDRWDKILLCEDKNCSICGYLAQTTYNYCPNCGTEMESEE